MKQSIQVINIKCWWCANTVTKTLDNLWVKNILVDIVTWKLEFDYDWDLKIITDKLSSLGYSEVNSEEAKSFLKKAKSYMSCVIGKMS